MKKLITLLSLLAIVMLGSCSSTESKANDVAKKAEAGQELNEEDFMAIVDYMNVALDDVEKTMQELGPLSSANQMQYREAANTLHEKYPLMSELGKEMVNNPAGRYLSDAGKERVLSVMRRMAAAPSILLYN